MKVIKNNYKKRNYQFPLKIRCDDCNSELEVEENDCYIGWLGQYYCTCPCCGLTIMLDEPEGITLTKDNLEFPTHYHHPGEDAVDVSPEEINKEVNRLITNLRNNKYEDDFGMLYTAGGNMFTFVKRYPGDKDYYVVVTKDFYDTHVPFEPEDYIEGRDYDD